MKKKDYDGILEKVGIEVTYEDGKRILSKYYQPDKKFSWEDLGINENNLVKDVADIKGNAYFYNSQVTDLRSLESIGGDAFFSKSQVKLLPSSLKVRGSLLKSHLQ